MTQYIVAKLVSRLATHEGVKLDELEYNLSDHIDPHALEAVVSNGSESCKLTFQVPGCEVTVNGLGQITIDDQQLSNQNNPSGSLFSDFADMVFLIDENRIYKDILMKPGNSVLLYEKPDKIIGSSISKILPPEVATQVEPIITSCLENGKEQSVRFELKVPAGTRYFDARILPVESIHGQRTVLVAVTDITDGQLAQNLHTQVNGR